jgi:hypothetical protein
VLLTSKTNSGTCRLRQRLLRLLEAAGKSLKKYRICPLGKFVQTRALALAELEGCVRQKGCCRRKISARYIGT